MPRPGPFSPSIGGTVLTVEGERHTVAQAGISLCVNDIVAAYLTKLSFS
ncbi:hypothetical protein AB0G00_27550 [Nocardia salmonicida]